MKAKAIRAQTSVEMKLTLRRGESLLVTLVIPLGILVFFSSVDAVNTTYKEPVDFLVPGVLALAVMSKTSLVAASPNLRDRLPTPPGSACAISNPGFVSAP